jgi:hypothetical protein
MNTYNDAQLSDCKFKCNVTSLEEIDLDHIPLCTGTFNVSLVGANNQVTTLPEVVGSLLNVIVELNKFNVEDYTHAVIVQSAIQS